MFQSRGFIIELRKKEFVSKCQLKHLSKYNYDKCVLLRMVDKICICCYKHGDFWQVASKHLRGSGCPKCCNEWRSKHMSGSLEYFLAHRTPEQFAKYSYDNAVFVNDKTPLSITCKIHGDFMQTPSAHKKNKGCPECATSGYKSELPGFIYVLTCDNILKIGITNRKGNTRTHEISTASKKKFIVSYKVFLEDGIKPQQIERIILKHLLANYKPITEKFNGSTECFLDVSLSDIIELIENNIKELNGT